MAADKGVSILRCCGPNDRKTDGAVHQGLAAGAAAPLRHARRTLQTARSLANRRCSWPDGVTDPRNLGAIIRSAAAFGAHGVLLPSRRSAGMTAVAWRTSAGAAARLPVGMATNLTRQLKEWAAEGLLIAGLDADGSTDIDTMNIDVDPLVVVVGSEGRGLSRLVRETCDLPCRSRWRRESITQRLSRGCYRRRDRLSPPCRGRCESDERQLAWVAQTTRGRVPLLTGMCTGAARAPSPACCTVGPSRHGRRRRAHPTNEVAGSLFVDDGEVTASAEVSAGIDMALHRWHA